MLFDTPSIPYCKQKKKISQFLRKVKCDNLKYGFLCFFLRKMLTSAPGALVKDTNYSIVI
jgi:hypothetical protein